MSSSSDCIWLVKFLWRETGQCLRSSRLWVSSSGALAIPSLTSFLFLFLFLFLSFSFLSFFFLWGRHDSPQSSEGCQKLLPPYLSYTQVWKSLLCHWSSPGGSWCWIELTRGGNSWFDLESGWRRPGQRGCAGRRQSLDEALVFSFMLGLVLRILFLILLCFLRNCGRVSRELNRLWQGIWIQRSLVFRWDIQRGCMSSRVEDSNAWMKGLARGGEKKGKEWPASKLQNQGD